MTKSKKFSFVPKEMFEDGVTQGVVTHDFEIPIHVEEPIKMKHSILIYIAGPYRGDVDKNVISAEKYAAEIAKNGIGFICPHSNGYPHDDLGIPEEYWLGMTLEQMRRCDAVFVCPGWIDSSGTLGEIREAYRLDKEVFFDLESLFRWADKKVKND